MNMDKCRVCEYNAVYAQGRYCYLLEKFILENEEHPNTCKLSRRDNDKVEKRS